MGRKYKALLHSHLVTVAILSATDVSSYCIHFVYTYSYVLQGAVDREVVQISKTPQKGSEMGRDLLSSLVWKNKPLCLGILNEVTNERLSR